MRCYSRDQEERIRGQALVREWTRSRLLDATQGARLEEELRVDLTRTNPYLRAGLALFTGLIVGASVLFVLVVLDLNRAMPVAMVAAAAAVVCFGLAEAAITRFRLDRFGVEEALAVASVLLLGVAASALTSTWRPWRSGDVSLAAGLLIGAAGGLFLYQRFGFVYAAAGAMACAGLIPFQLHLPPTVQHLLAAVILASLFLVTRSKRLLYKDAYPGDEYEWLQAAAWAGLYLTLNLQVTWPRIEGFFYWLTYVLTWVLPIAGIRLGIREKDRALLDVSLVMALVTLLTNKAYLRWPRHEWDPILLGVFLMAIAIALRRWLSRGPGGQRDGFTPARLLDKDSDVSELLGTASLKLQPDVPVMPSDPAKPGFDGGRSGGAGASGAF